MGQLTIYKLPSNQGFFNPQGRGMWKVSVNSSFHLKCYCFYQNHYGTQHFQLIRLQTDCVVLRSLALSSKNFVMGLTVTERESQRERCILWLSAHKWSGLMLISKSLWVTQAKMHKPSSALPGALAGNQIRIRTEVSGRCSHGMPASHAVVTNLSPHFSLQRTNSVHHNLRVLEWI